MSDYKIQHVDDIAWFTGPREIPGIKFRMAGRSLGVTAWGMNVLELDAGVTAYPEHDHQKDGQEEVYVVLRGDGTLVTGEERHAVKTGDLVRVGPTQRRKFLPGEHGITLLAIGATPGKAYEPRR